MPLTGPVTLTWVWEPNQGGLIMDVIDGNVPVAPATVQVSVINAQPGEPISFTIVGYPGIPQQILTADSTGVISRGTVTIPVGVTMGMVTIKATGTQTGLFGTDRFEILANVPAVTTPSDDVGPELIAQTGLIKWVFQDAMTGGLGSYVVPINPTSMSSPYVPPRPLVVESTTAPNGQALIWQGALRAYEWRFQGICKTEEHFDALNAYFGIKRRFYTIDHRNRAWVTTWESLSLVPINDPLYPYAHNYEVKALVYGEEVPT